MTDIDIVIKELAEAEEPCQSAECFNGVVCSDRIESNCPSCKGTNKVALHEWVRIACECGINEDPSCPACDKYHMRPCTLSEIDLAAVLVAMAEHTRRGVIPFEYRATREWQIIEGLWFDTPTEAVVRAIHAAMKEKVLDD